MTDQNRFGLDFLTIFFTTVEDEAIAERMQPAGDPLIGIRGVLARAQMHVEMVFFRILKLVFISYYSPGTARYESACCLPGAPRYGIPPRLRRVVSIDRLGQRSYQGHCATLGKK